MSSIFPFPAIKYKCKSPYYTLRDQLHHGSAYALPQGPWEHKCRGKGRYARLWEPAGSTCPSALYNAMHHLCTLAHQWFWSRKPLRALCQCMISWQLWCRWGQEGTLCSRVVSPVFHVSAKQCNKSLQMKILSQPEGNNSCWVLWRWPLQSCRSVWSRNTAFIPARV